MGLALLAIIWLITFVSSYFFAAKTWWLPHGASASAPWIDHQFALTYLLVGLNLMGSPIWAAERFAPAKPGSIPVEVTSMQFAWNFRYAGGDGKFGATDPKLMDPSAGSEAAIGLDTTD